MRRVPHPVGRQDVLQHDAARPRGHRHPARAGDARGRRRHLGRRLDVQGQRHRAVLPVRAPREPRAADLQAVARRRLRARAGRSQRDEPVAHRAQPARTGTARRRPTRPTPTSGARRTRRRRSSTSTRPSSPSNRSWASSSGTPRSRSPPRTSRSPSRPAVRSRSTARRSTGPGRPRPRGERDRWPPRPGHVRPDREPHHRGQEPGHLRGTGHGPAAHRVRAARQRDPQRGHDRQLPRSTVVDSAG